MRANDMHVKVLFGFLDFNSMPLNGKSSWCHLQHRLVLELSVGLSFDQRQAQWRIDLFLAAATSIVSTILPITGAEPALFGVYAVDLLSRWRALRGFRKTLEDDHD